MQPPSGGPPGRTAAVQRGRGSALDAAHHDAFGEVLLHKGVDAEDGEHDDHDGGHLDIGRGQGAVHKEQPGDGVDVVAIFMSSTSWPSTSWKPLITRNLRKTASR